MSNKRMVRVYAKQSEGNYFQDGGAQAAPQIDQQQLMQIVQQYSEITGDDPQAIMQQLSQMDQGSQMQIVQKMVETIQGGGQPQGAPQEQMAPQGGPSPEEIAMMEQQGQGQMAPEMRLGGIADYAKSTKRLLRKELGGVTKKNDTYDSIQEKLSKTVSSAIGKNFTDNLIENASNRFVERAPQAFMQNGGFTDFSNPYMQSAQDMFAMQNQERLESKGDLFGTIADAFTPGMINPYVQVKGRVPGKGIFGPGFKENIYGASLEDLGMAQMGGQLLMQDGAEVELADTTIRDAYGNERMVTTSESEMWQARKGQDPNARLEDISFASQAPGYEGVFQPSAGKTAQYFDQPVGTGQRTQGNNSFDAELRMRGNVNKALENLYLKDAEVKYGMFGRDGFMGSRPGRGNVKKVTYNFGQSGAGSPQGTQSQQSLDNIDSRGRLIPSFGNQNMSDARLNRMERRGERQNAKGDEAYFERYGQYPTGQSDALSVPQELMLDPYSFDPNIGSENYDMPLPGFQNAGEIDNSDLFRITAKEKSGIGSMAAQLGRAGIDNFASAIDTAGAMGNQNLAYNAALNNPSIPSGNVGDLGSWTNTTGPSVFMQDRQMGMLPGRAGFTAPGMTNGYAFAQYGGQPDLSGYEIGDDAYLTDDEIEYVLKNGGKVEYY
jgi:hypothetical protein